MYAPRHAAIPSPESEVIDDLLEKFRLELLWITTDDSHGLDPVRVNGKHRKDVAA